LVVLSGVALAPTAAHADPGEHVSAFLPVAWTNRDYHGEMGVVDQNGIKADGLWVWSVTAGALPDGLVLDPATGQVQGFPLTAGQTDFSVQALDLADGATMAADLSILVLQTPPDPAPPGSTDPTTILNGALHQVQCVLTPGELQSTLNTLLYGTPPQPC
jgi:hypothetical protein